MTYHRSATRRSLGVRATLAAACVAAATVTAAATPAPPATAAPALVAFPGAEGFGAGATGGRGGDVVIVDTLEPFGPGSLGDALAPKDCKPRTVVFAVSGVIEVPGKHDLELTCGNLTVAGQTAPGAGITVNGRIDGYQAGGNIIMRHVRLRPPPITDTEGEKDDLGHKYDALQLSGNPKLMLDHLSLSWGSDETLDIYEGTSDATVQWTTIEQSNPEGQPEGPHNDAMIAGPDSPRVSFHHLLMAHHKARCPAMGAGPAELINSVAYDCQDAFVHHNPATGEFHLAGNTFIKGPSHKEFTPIYLDDEDPGGTTYWLSQNQITAPGQFEGVIDDIADTPLAEAAFTGATAAQVITTPTDFATLAEGYQPVTRQAPKDAYDAVLAQAGTFPRDAMTTETIDDVRGGKGDWKPNPPADLIAGLTPSAAPADADKDGMADAWESSHGLSPSDGADHAKTMPSGYTAIEEYVNGLSDQLVGQPRPAGDASTPAAGSPAAPQPGSGSGAGAPSTTGARPAVTAPGAATPAVAAVEPTADRLPLLLGVAAVGLGAAAVVIAVIALVAARRRPGSG
jgi:pectate lyase